MKLAPPLLACCLVLLVAGCSGGPTPEELILLRIDEAVEAAEARDLSALKGFIADEYGDGEGRGRQEIAAVAGYYLRLQPSIHVLRKVESIVVTGPGTARARVLVAAAGFEFAGLEGLRSADADLLRFDVEFVEQEPEDWRVRRAEWRGATLSDFF